ncbi:hypothetical protein [Lysinibacillus boronitolerans]|uniref:hypothetical protein n=1 Tax=Lysinibacillus boronitolerans TaxID=309788 RepID=UPI0012E01EB9|nr:hypothetical protein [Lysinibacillus boronitolerans]
MKDRREKVADRTLDLKDRGEVADRTLELKDRTEKVADNHAKRRSTSACRPSFFY